ncbi:MAG TPA: hypothetical protein VNS33_11985, partial [Bradyrhizobium sp.]|nr:hypothetical protein [Bradyrhizobium sp.]
LALPKTDAKQLTQSDIDRINEMFKPKGPPRWAVSTMAHTRHSLYPLSLRVVHAGLERCLLRENAVASLLSRSLKSLSFTLYLS